LIAKAVKQQNNTKTVKANKIATNSESAGLAVLQDEKQTLAEV